MTEEQNNLHTEAIDNRDELRSLLDAVSLEQPLPASGTELILLEVDPHRAHAYWNIDPAQARESLPLVLRVYDVTESGAVDQAGQAFDVEVHGLQGRWYLDFWRDNRTFVSEIGYRQPDGTLSLLARSNEVNTPSAEPAENASTGQHQDHNGEPLHTDWPGDHQAPADTQTPTDSVPDTQITASDDKAAPSAPLVAEPITLLEPEFPLPLWPASVADTNEPVMQKAVPSAQLPRHHPEDAIIAAGDASVAFEDEVMSGNAHDNRVTPEASIAIPEDMPHEFPTPEELLAAVTENHQALQAFYASAGPDYHDGSATSDEPAGAAAHDQPAQPGSPAPESLPPLEQIIGLSSLEHMGKDVLLEVNAELHIYGRSKPNTELTLYGQVVKTRPDGTFSVRRPLPHGAVVLPLLYTKPEH